MKFSFVDPFPEHYFSFFMNSESIREYWEETGYHPTSIETAWLIYSSFKLTFDEKCQFWECIAWKMPDMEIIGRPNCPHYDSLHNFLYRFMAVSKRFLTGLMIILIAFILLKMPMMIISLMRLFHQLIP